MKRGQSDGDVGKSPLGLIYKATGDVCARLSCQKPFGRINQKQKYCCPECQLSHTREIVELGKAEEVRRVMEASRGIAQSEVLPNSRRGIHAGKVERSARLQRVVEYLRRVVLCGDGWASTRDITVAAHTCAASACVGEINCDRVNPGYRILHRYNWIARLHEYKLVNEPGVAYEVE
jgi:hypothetical protein